MNYTSYFKNVNISSASMICNDCIKEVRSLKNYSFTNVESFCSSSSIRKLSTELEKNYKQIDYLINYLKGYLKVLQYAELIQKQQLKMKGITDYSTKSAYAQKISTELKSMIHLIGDLQNYSDISSGISFSISEFSSNNNIYSISQLQLEENFRLNYQKLKNLKSNFDSYGSKLYNSYKNFYSMKSIVGKDNYLYYGWYRVLSAYQRVMKKRDSIDNWWTSYLSNIALLEKQLPDNTTLSLKSVSSKKYSGNNEYQNLSVKKPIFSEYSKKGVSGTFKSDMAIAKEVLAGKWGNGDDRKKALAAAGYSYVSVQTIVNQMATANSQSSTYSSNENNNYSNYNTESNGNTDNPNTGFNGNKDDYNKTWGGKSTAELEKYKAEHPDYWKTRSKNDNGTTKNNNDLSDLQEKLRNTNNPIEKEKIEQQIASKYGLSKGDGTTLSSSKSSTITFTKTEGNSSIYIGSNGKSYYLENGQMKEYE